MLFHRLGGLFSASGLSERCWKCVVGGDVPEFSFSAGCCFCVVSAVRLSPGGVVVRPQPLPEGVANALLIVQKGVVNVLLGAIFIVQRALCFGRGIVQINRFQNGHPVVFFILTFVNSKFLVILILDYPLSKVVIYSIQRDG